MMPLWSESNNNDAGWWVAGATLVTTFVAGLSSILTIWWQQRKQQRADTIKEWQGLADRLEGDYDRVRTELSVVRKEHTHCQVEMAKLEGEMKVMQATLRRLQVATGDEAPGSVMPGVIVADSTGTMKVVSPALCILLHHMPKDLINKNVEMLIPDRLKEQHRAALEKARKTYSVPWPEKSIFTYALTREGTELPVTVTLSGWTTEGGEQMISAEIKRRFQGTEPSVPSQ